MKLGMMTYLSEPARSTRFSLANRRLVVESFSHLLSIMHVKTLCDRLLSLFIFVAATFRFEEPCMKHFIVVNPCTEAGCKAQQKGFEETSTTIKFKVKALVTGSC